MGVFCVRVWVCGSVDVWMGVCVFVRCGSVYVKCVRVGVCVCVCVRCVGVGVGVGGCEVCGCEVCVSVGV